MLILKNLSVSVGRKPILKNVSFLFEPGKTYAIMGPNGSGKSTLAYTIMGYPTYELDTHSRIHFLGKRIDTLSPDKRAQLGMFLSFQTPISLGGITVFQLLRLAMSGKKDPLQVQKIMNLFAKELKIKEELLNRSLNEGASGGEKKKLEVLQEAVLDPKLVIFDEVDTGVDVDALKTISGFIDHHKKEKTHIIITHYNRILKYLKPDSVLVMVNGELVKVGKGDLAEEIEEKGYENILKNYAAIK